MTGIKESGQKVEISKTVHTILLKFCMRPSFGTLIKSPLLTFDLETLCVALLAELGGVKIAIFLIFDY